MLMANNNISQTHRAQHPQELLCLGGGGKRISTDFTHLRCTLFWNHTLTAAFTIDESWFCYKRKLQHSIAKVDSHEQCRYFWIKINRKKTWFISKNDFFLKTVYFCSENRFIFWLKINRFLGINRISLSYWHRCYIWIILYGGLRIQIRIWINSNRILNPAYSTVFGHGYSVIYGFVYQ